MPRGGEPGQRVPDKLLAGPGDLRGCGRGLQPGGVGTTGPFPAIPVQGGDAGELQDPGRARVSG